MANNRRLRRIRHLRGRLNPLKEYDDGNFRRRFRLRKDSAITLTDILKDDLQHQTRRELPLTPLQQVLVTLRFYATASFQQVIGDLFGISNYAVCKVIHRVSRVIAKNKRKFISFPASSHGTKRRFYDMAGFPGVVGAIDCTYMRIVCSDRSNAIAFINRKQFYSINVQVVCDSEALITNIVARWPGSTHDSRIFDNSAIAEPFRNGSINGILVGDSGYACRSYLMTPILNPRNDAEVRYNDAQRRTRIVTERCFVILKRRFPCLHIGLRTRLENSPVIIVAVAALQNFAIMQREGEMTDVDLDDNDDEPEEPVGAADASGNVKRQLIITRHFV